MTEGVVGSERDSGNDKKLSDEMSTRSFIKFGSPWENVCVTQCGILCDEVRDLKGFP